MIITLYKMLVVLTGVYIVQNIMVSGGGCWGKNKRDALKSHLFGIKNVSQRGKIEMHIIYPWELILVTTPIVYPVFLSRTILLRIFRFVQYI